MLDYSSAAVQFGAVGNDPEKCVIEEGVSDEFVEGQNEFQGHQGLHTFCPKV